MTARRASTPGFSSLAFSVALLLFAVAVGQDWLGAPELLQAAVDAWFGLWGWIGERVGSTIMDAATPEPSPAA